MKEGKEILRVYPLQTNSGAMAMALDEVLLEKAGQGVSSLRFYQWDQPTVSLGYFQPHAAGNPFQGLPLVRRPTGGDLLIHHHELTYALALPDPLIRCKPEEVACLIHRVIARALRDWGVKTDCQPEKSRLPAGEAPEGVLCFLHPAPGDVMVLGSKVVGSAQRRRGGALIQHGSVLLATSPHAPWLQGIRELSGQNIGAAELALKLQMVIPTGLADQGIPLARVSTDWTDPEMGAAAHIARTRYENPEWTKRR